LKTAFGTVSIIFFSGFDVIIYKFEKTKKQINKY
jgi:hypothetical protein